MLRQIGYSFVLAVIWCLFNESFALDIFIFGFLLALFIVFLLRRAYLEPHYVQRLLRIVGFILIFIKEVIKANIAVIRIVYHPRLKLYLKPGILEYPLTVDTGFSITLLANAITLTPGTLSVDVSPDRKYLYIHFLHVDHPEKAKESIRNFLEKPILQIWNKATQEESIS